VRRRYQFSRLFLAPKFGKLCQHTEGVFCDAEETSVYSRY